MLTLLMKLLFSVSKSKALVDSSKIIISGFVDALAIHILCLSPPERFLPCSLMIVFIICLFGNIIFKPEISIIF